MAMSVYNRQNPFVYLLEMKEDEIFRKSQNAIKNMIILFIIIFFSIILYILDCVVYSKFQWLSLYIDVSIIIFTILQVTTAVRSVQAGKINEMIYGDQYKDINVNNEQLLAVINNYNISIGKVEFVIEFMKYVEVIYALAMAYRIIHLIAYVF